MSQINHFATKSGHH